MTQRSLRGAPEQAAAGAQARTRGSTVTSMRRRSTVWLLAACAVASAWSASEAAARADSYPARAIRIVNSLSPGSSADHLNRALAEGLSGRLYQRVLVENRPGASGNIAAMTVVRAPADGLTLLMASTASLAIQMTWSAGQLEYDLLEDLAPVSTVAQIPNGMFVSPTLPVNDLDGFVAHAKARPNQLLCGSSGVGGLLHLTCELFQKAAGVRLRHVPYKGSTAIRPDLIEGRVTLLFDNIPVYVPLVQAGKLKVLAVTSPERAASLPQVPTTAELGMRSLVSMGLFGLFAPLKTDGAIIRRLSGEARSVLAEAPLRDALRAQGIEPAGSTPQALRAQVESEIAKWAGVIKDAGILRKE